MINIPTYDSPKIQDKVVQELNTILATSGYIEYQYPIVHLGYDKDGNTYPSVYRNDGSWDNYMIFPDSRAKSFTFFEFNSGETLNDDDGTYYDLSLVFWGNLERLDNTKYYDFTAEIMQSMLVLLQDNDCIDITFETEGVFDNYSLYAEEERQTLMRPNTGFKINFKIRGLLCE